MVGAQETQKIICFATQSWEQELFSIFTFYMTEELRH